MKKFVGCFLALSRCSSFFQDMWICCHIFWNYFYPEQVRLLQVCINIFYMTFRFIWLVIHSSPFSCRGGKIGWQSQRLSRYMWETNYYAMMSKSGFWKKPRSKIMFTFKPVDWFWKCPKCPTMYCFQKSLGVNGLIVFLSVPERRVVVTNFGSTYWLWTTGRNHSCIPACLLCATSTLKSSGKH